MGNIAKKMQGFSTRPNPFDLADDYAYAQWRDKKWAEYPARIEALVVEVVNPCALSSLEEEAIRRCCRRANMAIYVTTTAGLNMDAAAVATMGRQFGLLRMDKNLYAEDDGISALTVSDQRRQFEYIPYSNRPIGWHTDGYYNSSAENIHAMVLHCAQPALQGGENAFMDHEMLYIQLRDENPEHIVALMQDDVMTIPANIEAGIEIRPEQTGPVFSIINTMNQSGHSNRSHLHMRYTARTRSIVWKADLKTQAAVECLKALLVLDSPYCFKKRFAAGEGIISNNILHTRTAFEDDDNADGVVSADSEASAKRLVYRGRYYDRID